MTISLEGAPRTKKNSQRLVKAKGRLIPLPSAAYEAWAGPLVVGLRSPMQRQLLGPPAAAWPLQEPVHVAALFYRDAARGDLVGYMQALADLLEEGGVVADDKWITCWDGTRLDKDAARPRVELTLTWGAR